MKRALHEDKVLKPVDPAIKDDNDWPIFHILNADIYSNDPSEGLISLLWADTLRPLTVTGRLDKVPRGQNHCCESNSPIHISAHDSRSPIVISRSALPTSIEIKNVEQYAYGQFDDGEVAFWASGKAGWFEIHPSRQYRATYKAMTEVINLLYFAADFYRDLKPKQLRQTPAEMVFASYAQDLASKDESAARAAFTRHRATLSSMMADGKEGIKWDQTKLYQLLAEAQANAEEKDEDVAQEGDTSNAASPVTPSEDDDDLPTRLARKGKSTLRPTMGSLSGKAAARQAALAGDDSPTLKRKGIQEANQQPPKRRGRPPKLQAGTAEADPALSNGDEESPLLPIEPVARPARPTLPNTEPPTRPQIEVTGTPLPSFAANLPGDVWACGYDGCSHKVYGASTNHDLISEHYRKHAHDCQAAIDLVQREQRPYLPVSHLIKRIRDMAAQQKALPGDGERDTGSNSQARGVREPVWMQELHKYPQPVKQRL